MAIAALPDTLAMAYQDTLFLSAEADLLIYGCDLAGDEDGISLTSSLAALTGADVAASTDGTGAASRGGDWVLEHATGSIETAVAVSAEAQAGWRGLLATETVADDFGSGGYTGNTGSNNWSGDWQELVESDGAGSGRVRIASGQLRIGGDEVSINGRGLEREANDHRAG